MSIKKKFTLIPANKLDAAIESVKKNGEKFFAQIHVVAVSVLHKLDQDGDIRQFRALYDALPRGIKAKALGDWGQTFGKVKVETGEDGKPQFTFAKDKTTDLQKAVEKPWYLFAPHKPAPTSIDVMTEFAGWLAKLEKRVDGMQEVKNADMLEKLRALAGLEVLELSKSEAALDAAGEAANAFDMDDMPGEGEEKPEAVVA